MCIYKGMVELDNPNTYKHIQVLNIHKPSHISADSSRKMFSLLLNLTDDGGFPCFVQFFVAKSGRTFDTELDVAVGFV